LSSSSMVPTFYGSNPQNITKKNQYLVDEASTRQENIHRTKSTSRCTMTATKEFQINILVYDPVERLFSPRILIRQTQGVKQDLTMEEAIDLGLTPSEEWMKDYCEWNNFHLNPNGFKGHPVFSNLEDIHKFNDTGAKLVERLQKEFEGNERVEVARFSPLYSNMEVGDAVSTWWYVRDRAYDYVVPIQDLPVSDELKSRLMAWRMRKSVDWLDAAHRRSVNLEGHDLEEHILWELNFRVQDDTTADGVNGVRVNRKRLEGAQESVESIHAGMKRMAMQ
jgi:hypothetical protein